MVSPTLFLGNVVLGCALTIDSSHGFLGAPGQRAQHPHDRHMKVFIDKDLNKNQSVVSMRDLSPDEMTDSDRVFYFMQHRLGAGSNVSSSKKGVSVTMKGGNAEQCTCSFTWAKGGCSCGKINEFFSCIESACASGCNCEKNQALNACEELEGLCAYTPLQCKGDSAPRCLVGDYDASKSRPCDKPWCKSGNGPGATKKQLPPGPEAIVAADNTMECVEETEKWLAILEKKKPPHGMAAEITLQCSSSLVWQHLGKSYDGCMDLAVSLAENYETKGLYFGWCRSVAMASSELLSKASAMLEQDPAVKPLVESCKADCPYITKMVSNIAAVSKQWEILFAPPPEGSTGPTPEQFEEAFDNYILVNTNICDLHEKARCTPETMPQPCHDLLAAVALPPDLMTGHFTRCDTRKPCFDACNGVDARYQAYMDEFIDLMYVRFEDEFPHEKADDKMCHRLDNFMECVNEPKCKPYMESQWITPESMAMQESSCKSMDDPCWQKRGSTCSAELAHLEKMQDEGNACSNIWTLMIWPEAFRPPNAADLVKACCDGFVALAKCEAGVGCKDFTYNSNTQGGMTIGTLADEHCPAWKEAR